MKHVMLTFVSPVNARYISEPIVYPDILGQPYRSIQTNESAIVCIERMLRAESLSRIFLIASDHVRNDLAPDNEFGSITHLDFLKRRISKECPTLDDCFTVLNYSDAVDGVAMLEKNILQIADIADAITDYARTCAGEKLTVHADMTGGFRHTSMMMLSIMQLLKYRGIEIGEVLYSDPNVPTVYRATEIQRMFSLINGADEFVKFGSVDAVLEYFGDNPSEPLNSLLKAMKTFSEAIKICRTAAIEGELQNLGKHIQTFREHSGKDIKSELFAKIIDTIETEYGVLLTAGATRLDIIRRCMKKGFWQQAMTLCTEWLPDEIVDRGICKPTDMSIALDAELDGLSFGRNWKQQLIIAYQGRRASDWQYQSAVNSFRRELRSLLEKLSNPFLKAAIDKAEYGSLPQFADEYSRGRSAFRKFQNGGGKFDDIEKRFPILTRAVRTIFDEKKQLSTFTKTFSAFARTVNYDRLPLFVSKLPGGVLIELFGLEPGKILSHGADKSEKKWRNREEQYRQLMNNGTLCSDIAEDAASDERHSVVGGDDRRVSRRDRAASAVDGGNVKSPPRTSAGISCCSETASGTNQRATRICRGLQTRGSTGLFGKPIQKRSEVLTKTPEIPSDNRGATAINAVTSRLSVAGKPQRSNAALSALRSVFQNRRMTSTHAL